ncbi:CCA tRNA nucleotidyltransferase, partial [Methanobrevibacter sp.]|uniref:CCA tRNA nucleotidyltransferase n=1 Tax=Methanobrevibacter sp. TaxID=66852 RepID=UPI00388FEA92
ENAGFEAWCVGGAVRDLIMGLTPSDYDITTNAEPEVIMSIFSKTVTTGIKHGTVTVVTDDGNIEVTTYRTEGMYSDHRSPDSVDFVKSVNEDINRRDFTVNAILYNPKKGIYDPQNGISDVKNKILRCIGEPHERFSEDALRIMRLFRFSAQLGFEIEKNTLKSALNLSSLLKNISVERIFTEFKRALTSKNPEALNPLLKCGALSFLEINSNEIPSILNHLTNDFSLRFAVFSHKNNCDALKVLKNLKADNQTIENVKIYTELINSPVPRSKSDIKRVLKFCSIKQINNILNYYNCLNIDVEKLYQYLNDIINNNEPYLIKDLAINGNDLKDLGYSGHKIGEILEILLDKVIDNPEINNREKLISLIEFE